MYTFFANEEAKLEEESKKNADKYIHEMLFGNPLTVKGRLISKDTFQSYGSPEIIVTRPLDDISEENLQSSIQNVTIQESEKSQKESKIKIKVRKIPKGVPDLNNFSVELSDDYNNS